MNNENISKESFKELSAGMDALKGSLSQSNLISEQEIKQAMHSKSAWMGKFVKGEFVVIAIFILFFLSVFYTAGMSIWLLISFVICAGIDTILDMRTLAVSKEWIQNESPTELCKKLVQQKVARKRQTIIMFILVVPWVIWFVYEYLKHAVPGVLEDKLTLIWGVMSALILFIAAIVVVVIYKKAQRTNDEMISQLGAFPEE